MPLKAKLSCPRSNHLLELKRGCSQGEIRQTLRGGEAQRKTDARSPRSGAAQQESHCFFRQKNELNTPSPCSAPCGLFIANLFNRLTPSPMRVPSTTDPSSGRVAGSARPPTRRASSPAPPLLPTLQPSIPLRGSYSWPHRPRTPCLGPHPTILLWPPQSHKELNLTNNQVSLEAGSFPVEPQVRSPALTSTWTASRETLEAMGELRQAADCRPCMFGLPCYRQLAPAL